MTGPRFLLRHLGNMGDMIFFVPPVLATLKRRYPDCHITFVTVWGFKEKRSWLTRQLRRSLPAERWGRRNQSGFSIHLIMTNPHIDQLVHWDDERLSLTGDICEEDGRRFPTWNRAYYDEQKRSGGYTGVYELDFGLGITDNPIERMYQAIGLPAEDYSDYRIYFTESDRQVAAAVMASAPRPRIVLLEGLANPNTRGWDPAKVPQLEAGIKKIYGVSPRWFGAAHVPWHQGRPLTLRENIATLTHGDVGIGVMTGPMHFAVAAGLPTVGLHADMPLHRLAPAYFLNRYITDTHRQHRTLLGPTGPTMQLLKNDGPSLNLTGAEAATQGSRGWLAPGRQATKTGMAAITVDEVLQVLGDMLPSR